MQRVTVTLEDELLTALDRVVATRGYQNRSEAVRDFTRAGLAQAAEEKGEAGECVAALVYVYDHEGRDLPKLLTKSFHNHHDLSLATMHVHLDHSSCMEVAVLRGDAEAVQHFADHVISERGVRHGQVVKIPVRIESRTHAHGAAPSHSHQHVRVREAG